MQHFPCTFLSRNYHSNSEGGGSGSSISRIFAPVTIKVNNDSSVNIGEEFCGPLNKQQIQSILNKLYIDQQIKEVAQEHGLDEYLFQEAFIRFRKFCQDSKVLPPELHIILSDIVQGSGHPHDVFPSFLEYAKQVFPHLKCMDDLFKISDLTNPPHWYPDARAMQRKIVFHAGPTNSGKTYHAMEQFLKAESGVYCGPLKLLATEVFNKSNDRGTVCDLVTGEERRYGRPESTPSSHVACTVEMASMSQKFDVGIVDEIQLLRDSTRGWAWTRALLGLCAQELHVCGEEAAIPLVEDLALCTGEEVEIRRYKRLTGLTTEDKALERLSNVQPGDCVVCFNKNDIHFVSRTIENLGHEVAVIYGGLPPGTKLAQAQRFNDPDNPCKVMVATDAIGMGLNLSIRRVIFYSITKPNVNEKGEKETNVLTVSQALQIAGRAGRYGTQWEHGFVTTMKAEDLPTMHRLLGSTPQQLERAGLHPTADQIELFAYHLPDYSLSSLIDVFNSVCSVDKTLYFMCGMEDFKFLADHIQHVSLPLRARYVFCCAPINKRMTFVCNVLLKFAQQFSQSQAATLNWLCLEVNWPFKPPTSLAELMHLEQVFDVFDLYLWFSYRFPDMFPEGVAVKALQSELDSLIEATVRSLTALIRANQPGTGSLNDALAMIRRTKAQNRSQSKANESVTVSLDDNVVEDDHHGIKVPVGRGRLAQHLLSKGILSPSMIAKLHKEWKEETRGQPSSASNKLSKKKKGNK